MTSDIEIMIMCF